MQFSSYQFIFIFLPTALAGYYGLPVAGAWRKLWLIGASLCFYAWGSPIHIGALAVSLGVNHVIASAMGRGAFRDLRLLWVGIAFNILLLSAFKYAHFLNLHLAAVFGWQWPGWFMAFPLGLSFFSIQQIMFLVDRYEGLVPARPFIDYARFVTFFPTITSGPLVHWREAQPVGASGLDADRLARGLYIFLIGLLKKAVVADTLRSWADLGFSNAGALTFWEAWAAALAFTFQLYYDFSGYSDMAVGLGGMFGIKLPNNFASPYRATSIIEFWKRWHITLTRFITTYIYTPILRVSGKVTFGKAMAATMATMVIAGAWHGSSWNYILWGAMQGGALVLNHLSRRLKWRIPKPVGWSLTFLFVLAAAVVFRAASVGEAWSLIAAMTEPPTSLAHPTFASVDLFEHLLVLPIGLTAAVFCFWSKNSQELAQKFSPSLGLAVMTAGMAFLGLLFMNATTVKTFLYRDF